MGDIRVVKNILGKYEVVRDNFKVHSDIEGMAETVMELLKPDPKIKRKVYTNDDMPKYLYQKYELRKSMVPSMYHVVMVTEWTGKKLFLIKDCHIRSEWTKNPYSITSPAKLFSYKKAKEIVDDKNKNLMIRMQVDENGNHIGATNYLYSPRKNEIIENGIVVGMKT